MKKVFNFLIGLGLTGILFSCQKDFLQKPETTGNTTIESVFSTTTSAENAIAAAYRASLIQGLWDGRSINNGILSGISGELNYGETWATLIYYINSGYQPTPRDNNKAQSSDNFFDNFSALRKCFIVMENIDKVADMDASMKGYVKAEMKGLIAYRYLGMFIRYGGVPIVTKSLEPSDDLNIPRASLQETLDYCVKMADEAAAGLPDKWDDKYTGRLTRGAVLAIKAKALLFAARPLFNSATPVIDFGSNNNLICFGTADQNRWSTAAAASEAALSWATQNGYGLINTGGAGANNPDPKAFDDYGTATSTPANKEVILAYKFDQNDSKFFRFYNRTSNNAERYLIDNYGMLSNFLPNYYAKDGTDQTWPGTGIANALPYSDYAAKMQNMEPRFKADNMAHAIDAWINPGNTLWTYYNAGTGTNRDGGRGKGDAVMTKYYYNAGSRLWFEFPLFRVAELYLNLAEAYNESGNSTKALENLNIVHNRAGLPSITETNKDRLRKIIQREWAVEFFNENHRLFDVKHWKLDNIGNGVLGGPMREFQFTLKSGQTDSKIAANLVSYYDQQTFVAYWHPKMFLEPFPQEEIDKGIIIQNPGY